MRNARLLSLVAIATVCTVTATTSVSSRVLAEPPGETQTGRSSAAVEQPLSNADIIRLTKAGVSETIIINSIGSKASAFDLSVDGLLALSGAGVSPKVIEAMQNAHEAATRSSRQQPPNRDAQSPSSSDTQAGLPNPWGIRSQLVGKDSTVPLRFPPTRMAALKNPEADLSTLARDTAVAVAIGKASEEAAVQIARSTGSLLPIGPMLGAGLYAMKLFRRDKGIWMVTFFEGRSATTVTRESRPEFELSFDSVPGVNPDEYTATILSVYSTPNNFRIVGKYRYKKTALVERIEDRIPVEVVAVRRGVIRVKPVSPLADGEYAIAIVPKAPDTADKGRPVKDEANEMAAAVEVTAFQYGVLRWDFAVAAASTRTGRPPREATERLGRDDVMCMFQLQSGRRNRAHQIEIAGWEVTAETPSR